MSRRARTRAVGRVALNNFEIAAGRARKLSADDVAQQVDLVRTAVAEFCKGQHCARHWASLADTSNMAETMAAMGLGRGPDADRVITAAQRVLCDVHQRHAQRGSWTLYADEIDALQWLAPLHGLQLQACGYGEFEDAFLRTARRIWQARQGNASADAVVVIGELIAAMPEQQPNSHSHLLT